MLRANNLSDLTDKGTARTTLSVHSKAEADAYRRLQDLLDITDVDGLAEALASKATPADITTAINALVDGAPAALDTLKELAEALEGSDDALAALVLAMGDKADKADTYTKVQVDALIPAFATKEEVWAGAVANEAVAPSILKAALEFQTLSLASNVATMNCHAGINFTVPQLTANATLANPTNKVDGRDGKINFSYDASARTLSLGSDWKKFAASPAIPTAANSKFTIVYSIIGTDVFYSVLVKP